MSYRIYQSLSVKEFIELKNSLNSLEFGISDLLKKQRFYLNEGSLSGDVLGLDYQSNVDCMLGNIGLAYADDRDANDFYFSFYVLKAYDIGGIRYFKRGEPYKESIAFASIQDEYPRYVEACIALFDSWTINDLTGKVKLY